MAPTPNWEQQSTFPNVSNSVTNLRTWSEQLPWKQSSSVFMCSLTQEYLNNLKQASEVKLRNWMPSSRSFTVCHCILTLLSGVRVVCLLIRLCFHFTAGTWRLIMIYTRVSAVRLLLERSCNWALDATCLSSSQFLFNFWLFEEGEVASKKTAQEIRTWMINSQEPES